MKCNVHKRQVQSFVVKNYFYFDITQTNLVFETIFGILSIDTIVV